MDKIEGRARLGLGVYLRNLHQSKTRFRHKVRTAVLLSGRTPQPRQIVAWKSQILHPWRCCVGPVMRNTYAAHTQHACCVTTQRCILQYFVLAGSKMVELCLEGWLSRNCVGEGAKHRKLQRCAAAQHAMLRACCVHVAYDETHATL